MDIIRRAVSLTSVLSMGLMITTGTSMVSALDSEVPQTDVTTVTGLVTDVNTQSAALVSGVDKLLLGLQDLQKDLQKKNGKEKEHGKLGKDAIKDIANLLSQAITLKASVVTLNGTSAQLVNANSVLVADIGTANDALNTLNGQVADLTGQVNTLTTVNANLIAENMGLSEQVGDLQGKLAFDDIAAKNAGLFSPTGFTYTTLSKVVLDTNANGVNAIDKASLCVGERVGVSMVEAAYLQIYANGGVVTYEGLIGGLVGNPLFKGFVMTYRQAFGLQDNFADAAAAYDFYAKRFIGQAAYKSGVSQISDQLKGLLQVAAADSGWTVVDSNYIDPSLAAVLGDTAVAQTVGIVLFNNNGTGTGGGGTGENLGGTGGTGGTGTGGGGLTGTGGDAGGTGGGVVGGGSGTGVL